MYTIDSIYMVEQVINKSIFVCQLFPIKTAEEAQVIITETRKKYRDATHNCYAYIFGDNGEYSKTNDDGEPSQTAGVVIYGVLQKNNLTNVLAIVTRYFGGIKLGSGGLIRAYSSTTAQVVTSANLLPIIKMTEITIITTYQDYNIIARLLNNYPEITKEFQDQIKLVYHIPSNDVPKVKSILSEATKNQVKFF